jgi:hypothetical protein
MRWKWLLGIVVILIVALIGTVYAILASYDFNNLKPKIVQIAKDSTGRDLRLGGDIHLEIGFTPSLVLEDLSFQNAPWGSRPDLVKIRRLEVQVALLPMIRGNIKVKRFVLIEPDILIETDHSGKSNLEFETSKKVGPVEPREETPANGSKLPALTFNRVRIENGHLTYKDGQSGKTYEVMLENLSLAGKDDSPFELELRGAYNDNPFEVAGTLGPLPALIDPEKSWPIKLTVKAGGATLTIDGVIRDVMNAKGLSLTAIAEGQSVPDMAILAGVTGIPDVGPFKVALKVADPGGTLAIEKLDVHLGNEELAKVEFTGGVKDLLAQRGIEIRFAVQGKELANLEKIAGQPLPFKGPFHVSGRASDLAPKIYKISDLKIAMGESHLGGSLKVSLAGKRPRLTVSLSGQKLDLRSILSEEDEKLNTAEQSAEPAKDRDRIFPDNPLALDSLKKADADVKIRAGLILLPRLELSDFSLEMVITDGSLRVKPLKFVIGGGSLDARFDLRPQGKAAKVAMALKIEQVDLGRMLKDLEVKDIPEGILDVDMSYNGQGESIAALMAGLNGKIVVVVGEGRINNKYFNLLGSDLSSSILQLFNPIKDSANYTELNCFVSRFDIKDGIAESTALVLDTSLMSVVGEGVLNLKTEELDLSIMLSPKKGVGVKGVGKLSLSLSELAKPLKLGGTLANPALAIDPTQTAITLGKMIGGVALFGPVGIAAALASGKSDAENPCLAAIEVAEKGAKVSDDTKREKKKGVVQKTTEGVGGLLKKLFGN